MKSLKVSDEVWHAAKVRASTKKITLQNYVEDALWTALGEKPTVTLEKTKEEK